ncbi:MAG: hypothetical protein WB612_11295 [Nitrososphaeraceae archaeon]
MSDGNIISARSNWLDSLILSFRIVFSRWPYLSIAALTAAIFWTVFSIFDQLIFFSPIVIFYLPADAVIGFILSTLTSILLGIIVSMNIYVLKHSKLKMNLASFFSGSTVSVLSSTCASCSSLGFLLVSTFGGAGIAASTFLSNYQTPLRVLSIVLLIWALYSIINKLSQTCKIN